MIQIENCYMKIIYLISIFCILMQVNLSAIDFSPSIDSNDSIAIQQIDSKELLSRRGKKVYYQNNLLSNQEVMDMYKDYPEISKLYSIGYTLAKVGQPLLIVSIVGTSTGLVLAGVGALSILLYPGSGGDQLFTTGVLIGFVCFQMIPISIVLKIIGRNNISGSVKRYNQSQIKSLGNTSFEYSIGIVSSGLGLQVRF